MGGIAIDILRPESRAEWLAFRKADITASAAAALLGVHPYTTPYQLWAEKTGRADDGADDKSPVLRRGLLLEPVVAQMLREERPDWEISYPLDLEYCRAPKLRIGATPDAFAFRPDLDGAGVIQFKTTSDYSFRNNWRDPDTAETIVPLWVAVQAIVEAKLTGAEWGAVAVLTVGHGIDLNVIDIPIHDRVFDRVCAEAVNFWKVVESGEHPPIDWQRDGRTVLDVYRESGGADAEISDPAAFNDLIGKYADAKRREREGKADADILRPQIIATLGNADGAETQEFRVTAKTQHKKPYTVTPKPVRVVRVTDKRAKEKGK